MFSKIVESLVKQALRGRKKANEIHNLGLRKRQISKTRSDITIPTRHWLV